MIIPMLEKTGLVLVVLAAVFCDVTQRRIPNKLIVFSMIVSAVFISLHSLLFLEPVYVDRIGAFFVGIILLIVPFAFRGIGAGDVKLLGVIGLFTGMLPVINIALVSFIVGGFLAIACLAISRFKATKSFNTVIISFFNSLVMRQLVTSDERRLAIPFAVPLAIGTLVVVLGGWSAI